MSVGWVNRLLVEGEWTLEYENQRSEIMWSEDWSTMIWGSNFVPMMSPLGLVMLALALMVLGKILLSLRTKKPFFGFALVAIVIAPLVTIAVTVPNTFVNGSVADADEVNANFVALVDEANTLDLRVAELETRAFILGLNGLSSSGEFNFSGETGSRAALEMCVAAYPGEPSAHLCGVEEVSRAIQTASYAGNGGAFENATTWTLNGQEDCSGLLNQTDLLGTTVTIHFGDQAPGAGSAIGDWYEVSTGIACGNSLPILCCR
jgi:hypothetical protein